MLASVEIDRHLAHHESVQVVVKELAGHAGNEGCAFNVRGRDLVDRNSNVSNVEDPVASRARGIDLDVRFANVLDRCVSILGKAPKSN